MTICIATDVVFPLTGGIAAFNRHLSSLLSNAGHRVILLSPGYESAENDSDEISVTGNLTHVVLKSAFREYKKNWTGYFKPGGFDAPNWIAMGLAMRDWLKKNHKEYSIDIIEASDYGGFGIFLTDENLPPVILTGHGSLLQYSRFNYTRDDDHARVIRKLESLSLQYADGVIAHSLLDQADLHVLFQRPVELALIPWEWPEYKMRETDTGKMVVIGGLQPIKGIYEMAEAMKIFQQEHPDIRVYWTGNDTSMAPGQQKMTSWLAENYTSVWQHSLIWQNTKNAVDTLKEIAGSSIVIIPTLFETFNYIALEAAAFGKPIIITEKAGAVWHFQHGISAWIIPANNASALAAAIRHLLLHPELCNELGRNAAERIKLLYQPEKIVQERIDIYYKIKANRKLVGQKPLESLDFLNAYHSSFRKIWFSFRSFIKKIAGR